MSSSRDVGPIAAFIKSLKQATQEQINNSEVQGDILEWKQEHEKELKTSEPFPIKRIRLKEIQIIDRSKGLRTLDAAIMDVSYQDGHKEVLYVPPNDLEKFHQHFATAGFKFREWQMLSRMFQKKLDWSQREKQYEDDIVLDYDAIHQAMLQEFKTIINSQKADPDLSLNLIDAGCGAASNLLEEAYKIAKENNIQKVRALGFDFEQNNVDQCNDPIKLADRPTAVKFIQMDMNTIEPMFKKHTHLYHDSHTINMVFSSGSMTRMTLRDAFESMTILKANWRSPTHFLLAAGETEVLFNERILEKIGYKIKITKEISRPMVYGGLAQHTLRNPLIICERLSEQEKLNYFKGRLQKKPDKLDLTLSPCPQFFIKKIAVQDAPALKKVSTLDLSFSDLEDSKTLIDDLKALPELKTINCMTDNPQLIKQLIQFSPSGMVLDLRFANNEALLSGSTKYLRRMENKEVLESKKDFSNPYNKFLHFIIQLYSRSSAEVRANLMKCFDLMTDIFIKNPKLFNPEVSLEGILHTLQFFAEANKQPELKQFLNELKPIEKISQNEILHAALAFVRANNVDALKLFVKKYNVSLTDICKTHTELLTDAVKHEARDIFKVFNEEKVDLTTTITLYERPTTLMHLAIHSKKYNVIPILAEVCPELVDLKDSDGLTPVMNAIRYNRKDTTDEDVEVLRAILACKPKLYGINRYGNTIGHDADNVEKIILLQNAGFEFVKDFKENHNEHKMTPLEARLFTLLNRSKEQWDYDGRSHFDPESWKCVLQMLKGDKSMDVDNPQFMYQGRWQSLNSRLIELSTIIASGKHNDKELIALFRDVVKKYYSDALYSIPRHLRPYY